MSFTFDALTALLKVDASDWNAGLSKAGDDLKGLKSKVETEGGGMADSLGGSLDGMLGDLMNWKTAVAGAVGATVFAIGKMAVDAAMEAETITTRLNSVLRATGEACGWSAEQISQLSAEIQAKSRFDDESAASAATMLAGMKEIKGDMFRETMLAAADLAEVMGTDLEGAASTLGRALVDPEQGMMRLKRAGITFTDAQKELIKSLQESGDLLGAQKIILDEVASRTAGAASDATKTLSGRIDSLWNSVGNLLERFGGPMIEVLKAVTFLLEGAVWAVNHLLDVMKIGSVPGWLFFWRDNLVTVEKALLRVRMAWNWLVGDLEEVAELTARLEELNKTTEELDATATEVTGDGTAPAAAPTAKKPAAKKKAAGGSHSGGGSHYSKTDAKPVDPFEGVARREREAAGDAKFNAQFLQAASPKDAENFVKSMNQEITTAAEKGGLRFDPMGKPDMKGFDSLMAIYKSRVSQMSGFDDATWKKMEDNVRQSLRMATATSGDMRAMHIQNAENAIAESERMFAEHQKNLDKTAADRTSAEKKATDDAAKEDEKKKADADKAKQQKYDEELKAGQSTPASQKAAQEKFDADKAAATAALQEASRNELQKQMQDQAAQFQAINGMNEMLGIGTAQQKQGMAELQQQIMGTMKNVRDSTGETRQANIVELQKMQDAWEKAYMAIREGSTKTVEQLVGDAKKQGEAGVKAAEQTTDAAKKRVRGGGSGGGGNSMIADLQSMSREFSSMLSGAFQGSAGLFSGGFTDFVDLISDPVAKLDVLLERETARLSGMAINARAFGIADNKAMDQVRKNIDEMTRQRGAAIMQRNRERQQAIDDANASFALDKKKAAASAAERDRESQEQLSSIFGLNQKPVVVNVNGVNDIRETVNKVEQELSRRGASLSGKKTPWTKKKKT